MKKCKKLMEGIIVVALIIFFSVGIIYLYLISNFTPLLNNDDKQEVEPNGNIDYFNGEILEITEEYLYVKPIEDWEWEEVAKVRLPLNGWKEFDSSQFQCGDIVRVPFNSSYMEWGEDEVFLSVIFQIYDLAE